MSVPQHEAYPHVVEIELLDEKHPKFEYLTLHEWSILGWLIDHVGSANWRNLGSRSGLNVRKSISIGFTTLERAIEFKLRWSGTNV